MYAYTHLPARKRWLHHSKVGLPAGAGEGSGNVFFLTYRISDSQDLRAQGNIKGEYIYIYMRKFPKKT